MDKQGSKSGGYDYPFLGTPEEDLMCSVCLLVQREPVLTSCCGNHFCLTCIESVKAQQMPCPLCNAQTFSTMLDKNFVRKTRELDVRCPQKGCDWEGTLGSLEIHLDLDKGSCKFLVTPCSNMCGKNVPITQLDEHYKVCPRRPYVCKFCGYEGIFEDMSSKHWAVCDNYPLPCSNRCGALDIKRKDLSAHKEFDCPLELVPCEFAYGGCDSWMPREELPKHLSDKVHYHLSIVSKQFSQMMSQFSLDLNQGVSQQLVSRDTEIQQMQTQLKQNEKEINQLKTRLQVVEEELDYVKTDCIVLKSTLLLPPIEFVMTDFVKYKRDEMQWLSPPFYSHLGGYCLCLSVDANGIDEACGSHVSLYVNLMMGEFDEHLQWPFRGEVQVSLCNHKQMERSIKESIIFDYDTPLEVSGRVQQGEVAESGLGILKFVEHAHLMHNPAKMSSAFLKNNCLRFKVASVNVHS